MQTCEGMGFVQGQVTCSSTCHLDWSGCDVCGSDPRIEACARDGFLWASRPNGTDPLLARFELDGTMTTTTLALGTINFFTQLAWTGSEARLFWDQSFISLDRKGHALGTIRTLIGDGNATCRFLLSSVRGPQCYYPRGGGSRYLEASAAESRAPATDRSSCWTKTAWHSRRSSSSRTAARGPSSSVSSWRCAGAGARASRVHALRDSACAATRHPCEGHGRRARR